MPEPPTGASHASVRAGFSSAFGVALLGLLYRVWLVPRYFGHEEEDWGNLQIARGVAESGFRWLELDHMPGFAWMVAALHLAGLDVQTAAVAVPLVTGALVVGLVTWIGARWFDLTTGLIAGLLVAVQPEAALYSATALRESPYLAAALLGVLLCGERRLVLGGAVLSAAFLLRFNAFFSLWPALLIAAAWLAGRDRAAAGRALLGAGLLGATTLAWALVYRLHPDGGTLRFWGGVFDRNTGGAVADLSSREHIQAMIEAVLGLTVRVLPAHLGPAVLLLVPLGVLAALWPLLRSRAPGAPEPDRIEEQRAWLALCALGTGALLYATAVVSTYEWFHNLYWKWLTPSVPFLALLGVHGARALLRALPSPMRAPVAVVLLASTLLAFGLQTRSQLRLSERMYGVQVRAARWIEEAYIEDITIVADGIPAWYLNRRPSERVVVSWSDPEVPGEREAFGRYLFEHRVAAVLWFREEWVGAAQKAPWLAEGRAAEAGPVVLKPIAWSDEYWMIGYAVETAHAVPPPNRQPPAGAWFPPPSWEPTP
jgi:hypothetical protein